MAGLSHDTLVVGLDIGTTKVCAAVAEQLGGLPRIIGVGKSVSSGLRKGVIVDIESTVRAINEAIDKAEVMAGCKVYSVFTGTTGSHIRSFNSNGLVDISSGEVSQSDLKRVMTAAVASLAVRDREVLHILPQSFSIDNQKGIRDPIGMSGVCLGAQVHTVTAGATPVQNVIKCAQKCSLIVEDMALTHLASADAVLTQDEKELGVAAIDIGGGTTDIVVYSKGAVFQTEVIPIGGQHLTKDIAVGLRTSQKDAEKVKKNFGTASSLLIGKDEVIDVQSIDGRPNRILRRQILSDIIEPRVHEIFELVSKALSPSIKDRVLASGFVLTGGTAMLPGIVEVAEERLGLPVRLGLPRYVGSIDSALDDPSYATVVGLVQQGLKADEIQVEKGYQNTIYNKVKRRMSAWIQEMI